MPTEYKPHVKRMETMKCLAPRICSDLINSEYGPKGQQSQKSRNSKLLEKSFTDQIKIIQQHRGELQNLQQMRTKRFLER